MQETNLREKTLGKRIQHLRRQQGLTQEALAESLGVTGQAVSKWENDLSCPDIMTLAPLARLLGVTVDTLLTGESPAQGGMTSPAPPRKPEELIVRMAIQEADGPRVCLNLPYTVFRLGATYGLIKFTFTAHAGEVDAEETARALADLDFRRIVELIESGVTGRLLDTGGDVRVTIWTE